eukprot:CFRG5696T1
MFLTRPIEGLMRWFHKPKLDTSKPLLVFYHADETLNAVVSLLDEWSGHGSFEALMSRLRACQQDLLLAVVMVMEGMHMEERNLLVCRDYQLKYPDDVREEVMGYYSPLWFGAECLAAGSVIADKEEESQNLRPSAIQLCKVIEKLRRLLRKQVFIADNCYTHEMVEMMIEFDVCWTTFERGYVSSWVKVKTPQQYDQQLDLTVMFSYAVMRALKSGNVTQDMIDYYEPGLMMAIPRLGMIWGLRVCEPAIEVPPKLNDDVLYFFHSSFDALTSLKMDLSKLSDEEVEHLEQYICAFLHETDQPLPWLRKTASRQSSSIDDADGIISTRIPSLNMVALSSDMVVAIAEDGDEEYSSGSTLSTLLEQELVEDPKQDDVVSMVQIQDQGDNETCNEDKSEHAPTANESISIVHDTDIHMNGLSKVHTCTQNHDQVSLGNQHQHQHQHEADKASLSSSISSVNSRTLQENGLPIVGPAEPTVTLSAAVLGLISRKTPMQTSSVADRVGGTGINNLCFMSSTSEEEILTRYHAYADTHIQQQDTGTHLPAHSQAELQPRTDKARQSQLNSSSLNKQKASSSSESNPVFMTAKLSANAKAKTTDQEDGQEISNSSITSMDEKLRSNHDNTEPKIMPRQSPICTHTNTSDSHSPVSTLVNPASIASLNLKSEVIASEQTGLSNLDESVTESAESVRDSTGSIESDTESVESDTTSVDSKDHDDVDCETSRKGEATVVYQRLFLQIAEIADHLQSGEHAKDVRTILKNVFAMYMASDSDTESDAGDVVGNSDESASVSVSQSLGHAISTRVHRGEGFVSERDELEDFSRFDVLGDGLGGIGVTSASVSTAAILSEVSDSSADNPFEENVYNSHLNNSDKSRGVSMDVRGIRDNTLNSGSRRNGPEGMPKSDSLLNGESSSSSNDKIEEEIDNATGYVSPPGIAGVSDSLGPALALSAQLEIPQSPPFVPPCALHLSHVPLQSHPYTEAVLPSTSTQQDEHSHSYPHIRTSSTPERAHLTLAHLESTPPHAITHRGGGVYISG